MALKLEPKHSKEQITFRIDSEIAKRVRAAAKAHRAQIIDVVEYCFTLGLVDLEKNPRRMRVSEQ